MKLIGATAHYVTADLDEGPIIEQEVARVDHSDSPEDLAAIGRDAERVALARAVRPAPRPPHRHLQVTFARVVGVTPAGEHRYHRPLYSMCYALMANLLFAGID